MRQLIEIHSTIAVAAVKVVSVHAFYYLKMLTEFFRTFSLNRVDPKTQLDECERVCLRFTAPFDRLPYLHSVISTPLCFRCLCLGFVNSD